MDDADLVAAAHTAFTPYVLEQLSGRIGLPPDAIRQVVERAVPGVMLMLMAKAGSTDSAQRMFGVMASAEANARIAAQLAGLTASSHGLKAVERAGHALALRIADSREIAAISDHVAAATGVPPQAAHALTDVTSAVVFGVAKHHILLEQGGAEDLPGLLAYQWPIAAPRLAEGYASALGFESAAAFADTVPQRLVEVAAASARTNAPPTNGMRPGGDHRRDPGGPTGSAGNACGPSTTPTLLCTSEPAAAPPRGSRAWVGAIAVVLVALSGVIVYGYRQKTADDESASRASNTASGSLTAVTPASAASAPPVPPAPQSSADSGVSSEATASNAPVSPDATSATSATASDAQPASAASQ